MNTYKITFLNRESKNIQANSFKASEDGDVAFFYKKTGFIKQELVASFTQIARVEKT